MSEKHKVSINNGFYEARWTPNSFFLLSLFDGLLFCLFSNWGFFPIGGPLDVLDIADLFFLDFRLLFFCGVFVARMLRPFFRLLFSTGDYFGSFPKIGHLSLVFGLQRKFFMDIYMEMNFRFLLVSC